MADKFDPYRESLVVETETIWTSECDHLSQEERSRIEASLHDAPKDCTSLAYIRLHTGFCRQITVTAEELKRVQGG